MIKSMIELLQKYLPEFLLGFRNTLLASLFSLIGSLAIGTTVALLEIAPQKILRIIARIYVEIFRNIPLIVIVMFFFIVLPMQGIRISGFVAGTIGLTIYTSAFIAETVRSGIQSIPKGQMEAGISQGFSHFEIMRYIILPQAFKIVIPPLGNQFINLIKNSSILAMVAGFDLMYQGDFVAMNTFQTVASYSLVALFYLILTLPISHLMIYLEQKLTVKGA